MYKRKYNLYSCKLKLNNHLFFVVHFIWIFSSKVKFFSLIYSTLNFGNYYAYYGILDVNNLNLGNIVL